MEVQRVYRVGDDKTKDVRNDLQRKGWRISQLITLNNNLYCLLDPPPVVEDKIYTHEQFIAGVISFALWANDRELSGRNLQTEAEMYFKFAKPV